jgi:futalosine hydrolase
MVLLIAATKMEVLPLMRRYDLDTSNPYSGGFYDVEMGSLQLLITGVGMTATAFALGQYLAKQTPRLVINVGIAGALDPKLELGQVVHVVTERFGDLGAEDQHGGWIDFCQNGLIPGDMPPYSDGILVNPAGADANFLPKVNGITVQRVHGERSSIEAFQRQYPDAQVENMEGAAVFYACLMAGVPFLELRSVSNYVEPRDVSKWAIGPAITNLNNTLFDVLPLLRQVE